jgi:hypothetical protein
MHALFCSIWYICLLWIRTLVCPPEQIWMKQTWIQEELMHPSSRTRLVGRAGIKFSLSRSVLNHSASSYSKSESRAEPQAWATFIEPTCSFGISNSDGCNSPFLFYIDQATQGGKIVLQVLGSHCSVGGMSVEHKHPREVGIVSCITKSFICRCKLTMLSHITRIWEYPFIYVWYELLRKL